MNLIKKFPHYQLETLALLFNETPMTSGDIFLNLEKTMGDKHPSRASVIQYLNKLVAYHHVDYKEKTGKGGIHRVYKLKGNRDDFTVRLQAQLLTQFVEDYLEPLGAI